MARLFVTSINLNKNELQNAVIQNLSAAPSTPVQGQIYFNTTDKVLYYYNNSQWTTTAGDTETIQDIVGSFVVGGTGISATYNDAGNTLTFAIDSTVTTNSGTQTLTNKTLTDSTTFIQDEADNTKKMQFQLSGVTTATTRTLTVPDVNGTIITTGDTGTVTNTMLAGSIANTKLLNSSVTINGTSVSLGGTATITAAAPNALTIGTGLSGTSYNGSSAVTIAIDSTVATLTGIQTLTNKTLTDSTTYFQDETDTSKKLQFQLSGLTTATTRTLTIPDISGTIITSADTGTVTSTMIANGTIVDADINASAAIATSKLAANTISGVTLGNNLNALTIGTGLTGTSYNGTAGVTVAIDSTVATLTGSQTLTNKTLGSGTTLSANLAAGSFKITGLADPTSAQDAATKAYVDAAVSGLNVHDSVSAATTTNLVGTYSAGTTGADGGTGVGATFTITATGVWTIDGYTPALNERILVKDQTNQIHNGVYYVSTVGTTGVSAVLTRSSSEDNSIAGEVTAGDFVFVVNGTANQKTGWVQSNQGTSTSPIKGIKIGTDNIAFTQFSGAGTYSAGTGLTASGTTFNVGAGTGIVVNADDVAIDTAVVARKYTALIGNGSLTSIPVTHSLGNQYVTVQVFDATSFTLVDCDVTLSSSSQVTLGFAVAPTTNQYRVVVIG